MKIDKLTKRVMTGLNKANKMARSNGVLDFLLTENKKILDY